MKRYISAMVLLLVLITPVFIYADTWQIDSAHSSIGFMIRHLTVTNVKGNFNKAQGVVMIDDKDITNLRVEIMVDASSVYTGHAQRDEHLKGPDFFDVAKYPTITFVSKKVTKTDTNRLRVEGELTIHGVTKGIMVEVEGPTPEIKDPWGNLRRGATATSKINRRDFGITWNKVLDTGGLVVGDEVNIYVEVELVRK